MGDSRELGTHHAVLAVGVCLVAYALGLWALPDDAFLLATGFTAVAGGALLVAHARSGTTSERPSASVPAWCTFGAVLTCVSVGALFETGQLTLPTAGFAAVLSVSTAYLGSVVRTVAFPGRTAVRHRVSPWMATAVLVVAGLSAVGYYAMSISPVELVLVIGLSVMALYVGFVVPVGIVEIVRTSDPPHASEPYPDVSVVIPAYNEEGNLSKCIESILATDYPEERREIVVVDDGSSDGTYEEAVRYRDRGVEVYRRPNGGKDSALNLGIFCSSGDVVVPLDADSLLHRDALQVIVGAFQRNPDLGAVAGDVRVGNTDTALTKIQAIEYVFSINTLRRACSFFSAVPLVPGCLGGFRREALEDVHGYDPDTITEDFDVTIQVLDAGWDVEQVSALATTEAPFTIRDLYTQRKRWYSGGLQTVFKHVGLYGGSDSAFLHRFSFPFISLSFLFRPILGTLATALVLAGLFTSGGEFLLLGSLYFVGLIGVVTLLVLFVLDEEYRLLPWYVFLLVGYKQFIDIVFLRSIFGVLLGAETDWGDLRRRVKVENEA